MNLIDCTDNQQFPWADEFNHAWSSVISKIQIKMDIKERNIPLLMMLIFAVVLYFKLRRFLNNNSSDNLPCYPSGLIPDIQFQCDEHFRIARTLAAEFYLIPKQAIPLADFDSDGFDVDLLRIFNWEERKDG